MISIVVPMYNDEKYIGRCLDSLISQSYQQIEIIVISDGSTDKSEEIVRQYCKKDNRISLYVQKNMGAGPARNNGISHCKGEYIAFIDADDWYRSDAIEKLVAATNNGEYDFVVSSITNVNDINNDSLWSSSHFPDLKVKERRQAIIYYIEESINTGIQGPVSKLYRRSIINEKNLKFPDMRRSQDVAFNYIYLRHINSIKFISDPLYFYRMSMYIAQNDSSRRLDSNAMESRKMYIDAVIHLESILLETIKFADIDYDGNLKKLVDGDFIRQIWNVFCFAEPLSIKQKLAIIKKCGSNKMIECVCRTHTDYLPYTIMRLLLKYKFYVLLLFYIEITYAIRKFVTRKTKKSNSK